MATTYEFAQYRDPAVVRPQAGLITRIVSITPATWVINDAFKFAKLPKNAKLVALGNYLEVPDMDSSTGATISLQVTDGTTTKIIIDGSTAPQAGGVVHDQSATYGGQTGWVNFKTTSSNFYYRLLAKAAATGTFTGAAIICQVTYLTDGEYND